MQLSSDLNKIALKVDVLVECTSMPVATLLQDYESEVCRDLPIFKKHKLVPKCMKTYVILQLTSNSTKFQGKRMRFYN